MLRHIFPPSLSSPFSTTSCQPGIYLRCEWTVLRLYPGRPMSWSLAAPVVLAGVSKSSIDTGRAEWALERFGWERAEARL